MLSYGGNAQRVCEEGEAVGLGFETVVEDEVCLFVGSGWWRLGSGQLVEKGQGAKTEFAYVILFILDSVNLILLREC